ncbi:glycosyltransferase family 2 protein [Antarcticibacterium flavum]|uniref:Glycosyltransferase family 2 protein n=1 Tax=Antarcticibacterium flavum TaxID=2058175 RepID=A0A5B7X6R3_9FLAO|nr:MULTISPECIES: glycosyltransferase family 2 protein [Antarcticibacterium]MCM4159591.1 dTDP-Rha--alpha-D-GlcNAc-pyrophosphate polyprenol alpha-3-L-rhamnosyltransferase [Antarcticibacterium sp. W02-3]QCY70840.1 glycosyltransferase family 2 protein [Antarcticibacterium flavum]
MTIGVVILNWNGLELLKRFLPDVVKYSADARVYVADNASTDTSVKYVKENFPEVEIIQNEINGGYAKGYNDALAKVPEDIFILLNSDVQVTPHWLEGIKVVFQKDPAVAVVQPKILDYKRPEYFEYAGAAGGFIDRFGYPYCRGRIFTTLEKDEGQYDDETEIFWASGACLAIRKDRYYEAGALDENYFAHQEEIDLCWRLKNLGYKIKYTSSSIVYHVGGATLNSMHPRKTFYNFRNSLYNLVKNLPSHQLVWTIFVRMILDGVAAMMFLFQGKTAHFTAVFKAHLNFYKRLLLLLRERKKVVKNTRYFSKNSVVCSYFLKGEKKFSHF